MKLPPFFWWLVVATIMSGAIAIIIALTTPPAAAHSWYSMRTDPEYLNGCCGGEDCGELKIYPHTIEATEQGYVVNLSVAEAKAVNRLTSKPVTALVPWSRVQDSEDGKFHICIWTHDRSQPREGIICFFAPPST